MTPQDFEIARLKGGYSEARQVSFAPLSLSAQHVHENISFVYVLEGEFILNTAKGAQKHFAGETCILDKDVEHTEESGPDGAVILVTRK